jgi:putative DNA primase/helicase
VLDALRSNTVVTKDDGAQALARCPVPGHGQGRGDLNPSLSVKQRADGTGVGVTCHGGCCYTDVLSAIGLHPRDLYDEPLMRRARNPKTKYTYPGGKSKTRWVGPDGRKQTRWPKGGVGDGLFLADKIPDDCPLVFLCEGEPAAQAAWAVGAVGVASGGATRWCDVEPLRDRVVWAVVDRDNAGLRWAARYAQLLKGVAASVKWVRTPLDIAKADLCDHLDNELLLNQLQEFDPFTTSYGDDTQEDDEVGGVAGQPPGRHVGVADPEQHGGQVRMAYRVADRHAGRLIHVYGLGWHVWDGTRYVYDDRGYAKRAVLKELRRALAESLNDSDLRADVRKCESASGVNGVLDLTAALEPIAAAVADIDADPYLLNVANGTLNLKTLELQPHNPDNRITKVCRGGYRPEAESAAWAAFLERVLPDEQVRGFVQRLIGLSLLGAVREHVLAIWTGTGANGKGTLDRAVRHCLGDYALTAEPDLFMHREGAHPTGEMDLRGMRLVVVSESDRNRRLAEATMKRLTGGDTIRARRMRQDFVEFQPSHTALLITNHLPKVSGDDPAIWRRIRVVPFDVVIPEAEQDRTLDAVMESEADAVLTWAVKGWQHYLERGLDEPDSVKHATSAYQLASDAVSRFIAEACITGPAVKATTGQLFEAWERWRLADGAEQLSSKAFGQAVDGKGYPVTQATSGKRWRARIAVKPVMDENGDQ